jgi:hypothetical protein
MRLFYLAQLDGSISETTPSPPFQKEKQIHFICGEKQIHFLWHENFLRIFGKEMR